MTRWRSTAHVSPDVREYNYPSTSYLKHFFNIIVFCLQKLPPRCQVTVCKDAARLQQTVSMSLRKDQTPYTMLKPEDIMPSDDILCHHPSLNSRTDLKEHSGQHLEFIMPNTGPEGVGHDTGILNHAPPPDPAQV